MGEEGRGTVTEIGERWKENGTRLAKRRERMVWYGRRKVLGQKLNQTCVEERVADSPPPLPPLLRRFHGRWEEKITLLGKG